jgi:hypothetical protein
MYTIPLSNPAITMSKDMALPIQQLHNITMKDRGVHSGNYKITIKNKILLLLSVSQEILAQKLAFPSQARSEIGIVNNDTELH